MVWAKSWTQTPKLNWLNWDKYTAREQGVSALPPRELGLPDFQQGIAKVYDKMMEQNCIIHYNFFDFRSYSEIWVMIWICV